MALGLFAILGIFLGEFACGFGHYGFDRVIGPEGIIGESLITYQLTIQSKLQSRTKNAKLLQVWKWDSLGGIKRFFLLLTHSHSNPSKTHQFNFYSVGILMSVLCNISKTLMIISQVSALRDQQRSATPLVNANPEPHPRHVMKQSY